MGFIWSQQLRPQQILAKLQQKHRKHAKVLFQKYGGDKQVTKQSYLSKLGRLKNGQASDNCQIHNQKSEELLKDVEYYWQSLGLKQKSLEIFYDKEYTLQDLLDSVYKSVQKDQRPFLQKILKKAKENEAKFVTEFNTDNKTANGCCLALAYYTGQFQKSLERTCNILIQLVDALDLIKRSSQAEDKICISYWLLKSISFFPIYIGNVTRCIDLNLQKNEEQDYTPGNLITWLQYSSSSQGNHVNVTNQKRNTQITIFSTTGRAIAKYSQFQQQKQVIFKPFTHFLVLKRQQVDNKFYIQMREISIGLSTSNILWVDDNIFTPSWCYKRIMQRVINHNPKINFITKSSTKGAMAFMNSVIGQNRRKAQLRIVINFIRVKQQGDFKASVLFLKQLEDIGVVNLKILMIAPVARAVEAQMKKLIVRQYFVKITNDIVELQKFISFQ